MYATGIVVEECSGVLHAAWHCFTHTCFDIFCIRNFVLIACDTASVDSYSSLASQCFGSRYRERDFVEFLNLSFVFRLSA